LIRHHGRLAAVAAAGLLALGVAACGSDGGSGGSAGSGGSGDSAQLGGTINGAGATFPQPVYQEWASRFQEARGTTVNYQGIGSGGGIAQFTAGTVDFGATDAAMTDEELKAARAKGEPVHIPTVMGAVTIAYNVQGAPKGLKLDGQTVADVFLGKVTRWNDPAIARLNGGASLPSQSITVCHRSDESGTTANFTLFLSDYSSAWKRGPGQGKSVEWPTGTGAKGNDGVAACVKQNQGALGYVEQAYALANNFTTAAVKNKAGTFVEPSLQAASAAGAGLKLPDDLRIATIDAPGQQAYPITALTFLLVYRDMCQAGLDQGKAQRVKAFLQYGEGEGQQVAQKLQYAPLPANLKQATARKIDGLRCNGQPISVPGSSS
jgi:phosphate transport system substrate-binding protein